MRKNQKRKWVKIDRAIRLFGPNGIMSEEVLAVDIPSKEVSREMGPFFTRAGKELTFVEGYARKNSSDVSPHFKKSLGNSKYLRVLRKESAAQINHSNESPAHNKAKALAVRILEKSIELRKPLPWRRHIPEASTFSFSGDLLAEAMFIGMERVVEAPLGLRYRPDIAIFGRTLNGKGLREPEPKLLGVVEIERDSRFDTLKGLFYQALSVPVVTIDVRGMREDAITEDWLRRQLAALNNPCSSPGKAFVHLSPSIYQVFVDFPSWIRRKRHEYIIFARDDYFRNVLDELDYLKSGLRLGNEQVKINPYNPEQRYDKGVERTIRLLGPVAGKDFRAYNDLSFIRVFSRVPFGKRGPTYLFHMAMSALLSTHYDVLVGYLYDADMDSASISREGGIWMGKNSDGKPVRIVPKRTTIPLRKALKILEALDSQEE